MWMSIKFKTGSNCFPTGKQAVPLVKLIALKKGNIIPSLKLPAKLVRVENVESPPSVKLRMAAPALCPASKLGSVKEFVTLFQIDTKVPLKSSYLDSKVSL